jgi:hypothetical protein
MRLNVRRLIFLAFFVVTLQPRVSKAISDQVLHDVRCTHDLALLSFAPVGSSTDALAVVRLIPSPSSGSTVFKNAARGGGASTAVNESAETGVDEAGTWEIVIPLQQKQLSTHGSYHWVNQFREHERKLSVENLYSPFTEGGLVICEIHSGNSEKESFENVSLLPLGWEKFALPAYAQYRMRAKLFRESVSPIARGELDRMLADANPLIATMAVRTLLEAQQMQIESLRETIAGSESYRRAALTYLALTETHYISDEALQKAFDAIVTSGKALEEQKYTALGVLSALLLEPELWTSRPWIRNVTTALEAAVRRADAGADPYFRRMFALMRAN